MKKRLAVCLAMLMGAVVAGQQSDVLGIHNLGPGTPPAGPVTGPLPACNFCHAPHSGISMMGTPLWSQKLSTETTYTLYSSPTMVNQVLEPTLGSASNLCLSCHDGTVAPGQTVPYGSIQMTGSMANQDLFQGTLQAVHPFNFKLPLACDNDNLLASVCTGSTGNPAVKLIDGNVQCTSCHDPHVETIDPVAKNFLVVNNADSALCLACHVSQPGNIAGHAKAGIGIGKGASGTTGERHEVANQYNPFKEWRTSIHATVSHRVTRTAKGAGQYGSVSRNGCLSCHQSHNAPGGQQLLSGPTQPVPGMDGVTQNCIGCHGGTGNLSPAIPNVYAEFNKAGHPFPQGSNGHSYREATVLNNNRHATCVDCHDPHASRQTGVFVSAQIRGSQSGTTGVSATDGMTEIKPSLNQYETCLRCHGMSSGKQTLPVYGYAPLRAAIGGDPLNLLPQFGMAAKSSHPVMHESRSSLPQPSLLKFMRNLDGHTQGEPLTSRILCTDCHNSDDNREFGGTGPNGPHGSQYSHILERRYEYSQVAPGAPPSAGPGSTITNLLPAVTDPAASGPYSLCAKCHDLTSVMSDVSFSKHSKHVNAGFSCSVCHTAHGMGSVASNVSGERLVNFDLKVVGENEGAHSAVSNYFTSPISYNRANNTCTLRCHNYNHNADGTVTLATGNGAPVGRR